MDKNIISERTDGLSASMQSSQVKCTYSDPPELTVIGTQSKYHCTTIVSLNPAIQQTETQTV